MLGLVVDFHSLEALLHRIPGIGGTIGTGVGDTGLWWVKFSIEVDHPLAWRVVQELGHVLNYVSLSERLPTTFMPVSPPPSMNGGPREYLSWVIEATSADFAPTACAEWIEGRLPQPIDSVDAWKLDDDPR